MLVLTLTDYEYIEIETSHGEIIEIHHGHKRNNIAFVADKSISITRVRCKGARAGMGADGKQRDIHPIGTYGGRSF